MQKTKHKFANLVGNPVNVKQMHGTLLCAYISYILECFNSSTEPGFSKKMPTAIISSGTNAVTATAMLLRSCIRRNAWARPVL